MAVADSFSIVKNRGARNPISTAERLNVKKVTCGAIYIYSYNHACIWALYIPTYLAIATAKFVT
jgi:hypothetical protein